MFGITVLVKGGLTVLGAAGMIGASYLDGNITYGTYATMWWSSFLVFWIGLIPTATYWGKRLYNDN